MLQPGLLLGVATNRSSSWNIKPLLILVDTLKFKLSQRVHRHRKCLKSLNLKKQNKTRNVLTLMQMLYLEDWKKCWSEIYRIKDKLGLEQTRIRIDAHMHGLKKSQHFTKWSKEQPQLTNLLTYMKLGFVNFWFSYSLPALTMHTI